MNITLMNTDSPNNMINKVCTIVADYTGAVARVNVSVENPVLILEESVANIMGANYCYISDFGRYYFITDKTCDVNGMWTISLKVDVLESFKYDIYQLKGIVQRQKDNYDMYLRDDKIPVGARKTVAVRKIGNTIMPVDASNVPCVIMLVLGG